VQLLVEVASDVDEEVAFVEDAPDLLAVVCGLILVALEESLCGVDRRRLVGMDAARVDSFAEVLESCGLWRTEK
jgi:hypothetical protein